MHSPTSHFVEVDGLRLHYVEAGEGAPVLFLHGWPTHSGLWRNIMPAVAPHRRVIAVDLPGFGESDKPLDASYSFRFFDKILDSFLAALELEKIGLVVHDLGGPVGLHWAASRRTRVSELAILNTLAFPELSWMVMAFFAAVRVPGLKHTFSTPWGLRQTMRMGIRDKKRVDDTLVQLYQRPYESSAARQALLQTLYGMHPGGFETIAAALPSFDVPTRLLYGERDWILPRVAKTMARLQTCMPHAELSSIPDCGHFLQEDQPEVVAAALAEFFASHTP